MAHTTLLSLFWRHENLARRDVDPRRHLRKQVVTISLCSDLGPLCMRLLDTATRVRVVSALVEGCSIRATCRMTGVAKGTVLKLLADLGVACRAYHDAHVRGDRHRCRLEADGRLSRGHPRRGLRVRVHARRRRAHRDAHPAHDGRRLKAPPFTNARICFQTQLTGHAPAPYRSRAQGGPSIATGSSRLRYSESIRSPNSSSLSQTSRAPDVTRVGTVIDRRSSTPDTWTRSTGGGPDGSRRCTREPRR